MLQATGFQGEGDDLGSIHSHPSFVMAGPGPEDAHNMNNNNSSNGYRIPHHNRTSFNTPSNHPFSSNSNQLMGQGTWGGGIQVQLCGRTGVAGPGGRRCCTGRSFQGTSAGINAVFGVCIYEAQITGYTNCAVSGEVLWPLRSFTGVCWGLGTGADTFPVDMGKN